MIPVAQPALNGNELKYVRECIESTWISSQGRFIDLFEESVASMAGAKHAIATNNGTTALHLALVALGIGPGDEVIVPTLTYIASANSVRYCGATPVFVDSLPDTMCLDPQDVSRKITPNTVAIMPVHLYGQPAEMLELQRLAETHQLSIVEDAAEAHCAEVAGQRVGSFGAANAFSFFGNKIITTGEGGAVTTNDDHLAARLRILRGQGMDPKRRYWFPIVGYNYRMTNIAAAIGLAQMERIDEIVSKRDAVARKYTEILSESDLLTIPRSRKSSRSVNWCYTVFLNRATEESRDLVMSKMYDSGVDSRPVFHPLHTMPPYRDGSSHPVAEQLGSSGLSLPTFEDISDSEIDQVTTALLRAASSVL